MKIFIKGGKYVVKNDKGILLKNKTGLGSKSVAHFNTPEEAKAGIREQFEMLKYQTMGQYTF